MGIFAVAQAKEGDEQIVKRDGHSHTEFCPHGSGDQVERMIQKAIHLGFTDYSITEHAPLPPAFAKVYAGEPTGLTEASMSTQDLPDYFAECERLKALYAERIRLHIGFEVDFLPDFTDWTRRFLDEYGPRTDDNLLAVHFMPGREGYYWCIDDTIADFQSGLLSQVHNEQELYQRYFQLIDRSIHAQLGKYTPKRIAHITLIKKFQDQLKLDSRCDGKRRKQLKTVLQSLVQQQKELDFNAAGLYKPYCNEPYPNFSIAQIAKSLHIPLIYGSDAHSVAEVGQGYNALAEFLS